MSVILLSICCKSDYDNMQSDGSFQLLLIYCRAGPSLSAYNYDSSYGKRALVMLYRGIMEQVSITFARYCHFLSCIPFISHFSMYVYK